jgi:hypothetical protein
MATLTRPMPVFWADDARAQLGEERWTQAQRDPRSPDLLTWNVFQTLENHFDQEWLAYRLQQFGGTAMTGPVRLQLWTGATTEPLLQPSRGYLAAVTERAQGGDVSAFNQSIEVPIRIESPDVLCLVDTMLDTVPRGTAGRERLLELVDAGLEHARRLSKSLSVAVVYESGTEGATQISARMDQLRRTLAEELPHQPGAADVQLREVSWQQLLRVWESEVDHLRLPTSPKRFLAHVKRHGLY